MFVYVFKRNDDYKSIALPTELQGHGWIYKSKAIFCNTK